MQAVTFPVILYFLSLACTDVVSPNVPVCTTEYHQVKDWMCVPSNYYLSHGTLQDSGDKKTCYHLCDVNEKEISMPETVAIARVTTQYTCCPLGFRFNSRGTCSFYQTGARSDCCPSNWEYDATGECVRVSYA